MRKDETLACQEKGMQKTVPESSQQSTAGLFCACLGGRTRPLATQSLHLLDSLQLVQGFRKSCLAPNPVPTQ